MNKRGFFTLLAVVIMFVSITGCAPKSTEPITIGMIAQLSGGASFLGPSEEYAARAAVEEINKNGGLLGRTLAVQVCDDATDPAVANDCAKRLINDDKVSALFAATTSASREAVMPVIEQNGNILYFYNAIYEGHSCAPNMWVSGTMPENQIFPVIPYMQQEYGGNKWYFVGNDYNWPQNTAKVSKVAFEENNSELLGEKYVPVGTTDFTSILQDISEKKPNYILLIVLPGDAVAFMTQFHSLGLDKDIKVIATLVEESTVKAMGPASEGLFIPVGYYVNVDTPRNKEFLASYTAAFGKDAPIQNFISMHSYDAIHLWALAVQKAGTLEIGAVSDALPTVKFDSPTGNVSFDAKTHHAFLPITLIEIKSGVITPVKSFGPIDPGQQCDFPTP
jgi:urea transport system substrate-binding protein